MKHALSVKNVKKSYSNCQAVKGVSFSVPVGVCFGILGPNGAGKTTLMSMLEGITTLDEGSIKVLDMDITKDLKHIQARIGVQLQSNNYFKFLNVGQLLKFYLELRQSAAREADKAPISVDEILSMLALTDKKDVKVSELSGGQAQRFSIAVAMLDDPDIIFLDEPTSALDPQNRRYTWEFIKQIKQKQNKTIILTTHFMEEAETLCDELIIMDHGEIIAQGAPKYLIQSLQKHQRINMRYKDGEFPSDMLHNLAGVERLERGHNSLTVYCDSSVNTTRSLFEFAHDHNINILEFDIDLPNLEDVFIAKTGTVLRDE